MFHRLMQGTALSSAVVLAGACLDRPLAALEPTIKTNFMIAVDQTSIDKVDILFDIDNSASMGDKQAYLAQAIPQMIARLVTPRCLDANGNAIAGVNASPATGLCATGTPEFHAVHDMHIGVVTSSLGSRLGDECSATSTIPVTAKGGPTVSRFNDDEGHLIDRVPPGASGDAGVAGVGGAGLPEGGGFLAWFPALGNTGSSPVTPPATLTTSAALEGDFAEIVGGAGQSGCGLESQLESWYRFLIQPDPYAQIVASPTTGGAVWSGVDTTILQQRHDFLRPDSLVAIVVLSDENDSEMDVRSFEGQGFLFLDSGFNPPRGTTACATDPGGNGCVTCPNGLKDGGVRRPRRAGRLQRPELPDVWRQVRRLERLGLRPRTSATRTCSRSTASPRSSPSRATTTG